MKLYSPLGNPRGNKILTLARYLQIDLETPPFQQGQAKSKEFAQKSPLRKYPLLETEEGNLYESNAIIRYLVRLSGKQELYGTTNIQMSQVDSWLETISNDLELAVCQWIYPILGYTEYVEAIHKKAQQDVKEILKHMDAILSKQPYLVGQVMTLADISAASVLVFPYRMVFDKPLRNTYKNIQKWFDGLISQPEFQYVWGKVHFAAQAQQPVPPKQKGQDKKPKEEEKKQQKQQKQQQPKQEKKKKEEDEEEDIPRPKKPTEPDYPETKFIMDEWKKLYANTKDRASTLPFFWEKIDGGWSVWYLNYQKAEGEGEVLYMTNNLLKGFIQRLEQMRKISFGILGIYGQEPKLEIRGVLMWRGADVHPWMNDHPSFEYYDHRKLDLTNDQDKQLLIDYWTKLEENEIVEGLPVQDTKIWK